MRVKVQIIKKHAVFTNECDYEDLQTLLKNYHRLKNKLFGSTVYEITFQGKNNQLDGFACDMKDILEINWKELKDEDIEKDKHVTWEPL